MAKRGSQVLEFIISFIVWSMLTWRLDALNISLGLIFSLLATMFFGELLAVTPGHALNPARYLWLLYYLPIFLWHMIISNVDVAYRVLHPKLPIDPGLIKIRTKLKSDIAKSLLANSLSLTPGSTTVDITGDEMYIHCIDINRPVREEAELFETLIARIFE